MSLGIIHGSVLCLIDIHMGKPCSVSKRVFCPNCFSVPEKNDHTGGWLWIFYCL